MHYVKIHSSTLDYNSQKWPSLVSNVECPLLKSQIFFTEISVLNIGFLDLRDVFLSLYLLFLFLLE